MTPPLVVMILAALTVQAPPFQPPSEVARAVVAQGVLVFDVPEQGQIRHEMEKDGPLFVTPMGETTAMVLRLPAYKAPYLMTVSSWLRGLGPATRVFVPTGIVFDPNFVALSRFGEENLRRDGDRLVVDLMIGDKLAGARYVLLFTRGNLIKKNLEIRDPKQKDSVESKISELLGFGRVQRSLDATIYAATGQQPPADIARKLGGPWLRVEGANIATLRQLLGAPASVHQDRNVTIWTYEKTAAGTVRVYIIDDVASLRPPK